jgi:ribosome biogenesis GTPase
MAILPRDNLLQRVDGFGQVRAVAANITQLLVCLAVNPEPNLFLLDQYLLSAEQQGIEAIILLNKIDLLEADTDPFEIGSIYRPLGYQFVATSIKSGRGMAEFRQLLGGQISVLSGVSGVGKSSLTSWLLPDEPIKIASISVANDEGRHTTRTSRLYHLSGGGDLIDTPGVRGFSPFVDSERPLGHGFREILQLSGACRFHNCQHLDEPSCAVIDAVACGKIAPSRYQNYLKMLAQAKSA